MSVFLLDFFGGIARSNAAKELENKDEYEDFGNEINDDNYDNDKGFY
jgi:hypothetical protein